MEFLTDSIRDCSGNVQQCGESGCTLERKARPHSAEPLQLKGDARIIKDMAEGRRVFTDAKHSRPSGCKNSVSTAHVRGSCGEHATWTPEPAAG